MANPLPPGWTEKRLSDLAAHYEQQSDEEAVAEFEAAASQADWPMIQVPVELVAAVQSLIEHFQSLKTSAQR